MAKQQLHVETCHDKVTLTPKSSPLLQRRRHNPATDKAAKAASAAHQSTKDIIALLDSIGARSHLNRSKSESDKQSNGSHGSADEDVHCSKNAATNASEETDSLESEGMRSTTLVDNAQNHDPFLLDEAMPMRGRSYSQHLSRVTLKDMEDGSTLSTLYERLQQCVNMSLDNSG